jgi:AcrR family transcriptional regulator
MDSEASAKDAKTEDAATPGVSLRAARRREIEAAAFTLLAEKGYRGASMLEIAKRAGASNQTLYAWYGNKQTLFRHLVEENGRAVTLILAEAAEGGGDPLATLRALGPALLAFATGDKAIIMNRAAIIDAGETGVLAEAIEGAARRPILAMTETVMARLIATGAFAAGTDAGEAAESYISLLFGETQLRQAMGQVPPLDEDTLNARADRALALTLRLYGLTGQPPSAAGEGFKANLPKQALKQIYSQSGIPTP